MHPLLTFDRDPIFGNRSEPLIKVETRLAQTRQRFWIWKASDFFWFWNEDEPDFYGLFFGSPPVTKLSTRTFEHWFSSTAEITDPQELRQVIHAQLHNRGWARALTLPDPRSGHNSLWRLLWRRREFALQNPYTGRAVRFHPEESWPKDSQYWRELNGLSRNSEFFAEMFWPLLLEQQGRLKSAFEFLDLPVEDQENPIRFGRGNKQEFLSVIRAALVLDYTWHDGFCRQLFVRFHSRTLAPVVDIYGWQKNVVPHPHLREAVSPRLGRLFSAFAIHLAAGFTFQGVVTTPFTMSRQNDHPLIFTEIEGPFIAHERLEAVLVMRDWLKDNAPQLLSEWA